LYSRPSDAAGSRLHAHVEVLYHVPIRTPAHWTLLCANNVSMRDTDIVWLHLSDWHQRGRDFDRVVVRDALIEDLRSRDRIARQLSRVDFIVFSGDLAFSGKPEEYETAAREFLTPVLSALALSRDRVFFVPGNHDIDRRDLELLPPLLERLKDRVTVNAWLTTPARRQALIQPFGAYSEFVRRFLGSHAPAEPAYGYARVLELRECRLAVVGMNSAWMCGQRVEGGEVNDYGYLILGEPQFYEPLQLSDVKTADLRIGILHHPSSWFSDVVRRAYVEPSLVRGFHFLLRGHEHNAHVEVPSGTSGHCAMISAGAAYDRREYPNGYNFVHLDLASGNGNVYLRKYDLVRGFQKDTSATGDDSPGLFPFSVPKRPSPVRLVEHIGAAPAELSVDLVKDCTDPDIRAALELYESRIPDDERFEAPDIVRWLREDQQQRSDGVAGPRDYFVVAKADSRVCGFTLLHYYQTLDLAFIAYLVAERGVAIDHGTISQRLLEKVAWLFANEEHLRSCKGFLLEVDDPTRSCTAEQIIERLARVRLFCMLAESLGFSLRALDFDYHQPLLWIPDPEEIGTEVPMLLMYARPSKIAGSSLAKTEVQRLLAFVYKWLYPEGFSDVEDENNLYRRYTDELYGREAARVADEVRTLPLREIRARAGR
jgi:hypothetical protein